MFLVDITCIIFTYDVGYKNRTCSSQEISTASRMFTTSLCKQHCAMQQAATGNQFRYTINCVRTGMNSACVDTAFLVYSLQQWWYVIMFCVSSAIICHSQLFEINARSHKMRSATILRY